MKAPAFPHRFLSVIAVATGAFVSAPASAASPCEAPAQYVRSPKVLDAGAPLLRPYVVAGFAALSLRERDGERWLELAAHSADEAGRALRAQTVPGEAAPVVRGEDARVWLRCPTAPAGA